MCKDTNALWLGPLYFVTLFYLCFLDFISSNAPELSIGNPARFLETNFTFHSSRL